MIPANTIMSITEPALDCLGLFGAIGRVLNVVDVDPQRRMWLDFELTDAYDMHTRNRVVLNVPDNMLDYCDTRAMWAERKRRDIYERAMK
ncbi:MAG: hypothetical protein K8H84_07905 [Sulfuricella denitrificans]|nr:hypothetical protein [Sulfuricella denitrificans]